MLSRWIDHEEWSQCLDHMDVYSVHENLFKIGAPQGMGAKFLVTLKDHFDPSGTMDTVDLYKAYLALILPVLHEHEVELQIHTVGSKGDFVPWDMYGTTDGMDTIPYPQDSFGLKLVWHTLGLINSVCDSLFTDGYRVTQVKLQSVLSGHWKRRLQNNVYCALEYMKGVHQVYPEMKFYLGDAMLQRRDHIKALDWQDAYAALHHTMMNDSNGYDHLNFGGIRIEFNKNWEDSLLFESAPGWSELSDSGAFDLVQSFGWEVGIEHNHPHANDEWGYERLVLRTAEKLHELDLHGNFAVLHSDAAGGQGHSYPYAVAPEYREPHETPTFSSVLNKVFDYYDHYYCPLSAVHDLQNPGAVIVFPNPFRAATYITYQLKYPAQVNLTVFDVFGRTILWKETYMDAGSHRFTWDGKDTYGSSLAAGLYFCRVDINGTLGGSYVMIKQD